MCDHGRQDSRRITALSLTFTASSKSFSACPKHIARYHRKMRHSRRLTSFSVRQCRESADRRISYFR